MTDTSRKNVRWTWELCDKWVRENTGCKLLSAEYIPPRKGKMKFTCEDCGEPFECGWSTFKCRGQHRCRTCGQREAAVKRGKSQRKLPSVFNKEVKAIYGDTIELLGSYETCSSKIHCRCTICGNSNWFPRAGKLLEGCGCPECKKKKHSLFMVKPSSTFIAEVNSLHGGKYKLLGDYLGGSKKIETMCLICGNTWFPRAQNLLDGQGCPKCAAAFRSKQMTKTDKEYKQDVFRYHGTRYTILSEYTGSNSNVEVLCNDCGKKWCTRAHSLLCGKGCPNCASPKGERALQNLMQSLQLHFIEQFTFPDCIGSKGGVCRFDCAVLDSSDQSPLLLIEYDGEQHFKPVEFFGGQQEFEYRQANDRIKDSYCKDHGIPLLRISYKQFDQIEQLVTDKLYELNILQKEAA